MTGDCLIAFAVVPPVRAQRALTITVVRDVIVGAAAYVYSVTTDEILSAVRRRDVAAARAAACLVLRECSLSFQAIGTAMGVDHSTAIHAARRPLDLRAVEMIRDRSRLSLERDYGRDYIDEWIGLRRAELALYTVPRTAKVPPLEIVERPSKAPLPMPEAGRSANRRKPTNKRPDCRCGHEAVDHQQRGTGACTGYPDAIGECSCAKYEPEAEAKK